MGGGFGKFTRRLRRDELVVMTLANEDTRMAADRDNQHDGQQSHISRFASCVQLCYYYWLEIGLAGSASS